MWFSHQPSIILFYLMVTKQRLMGNSSLKSLTFLILLSLNSLGQNANESDPEYKYRRNFEMAEFFRPKELTIKQEILIKLNKLAKNVFEDRKKRKGKEAVERVLLNCEGSLRRALAMLAPKRHYSHVRERIVYYDDDKFFFYFFVDKDQLLSNAIIAVHKETGYPYTIQAHTLRAQKDLK